MIGETLTESLVHLLQGEQVPVENLNGNKNIISLFNRILANQGIESVSRTIHEKALKDDVIRSALVEAESIIKNRQAENAEPADDLETFPPLPVKMNFFPQSFPLKDVYMQYSKRISPEGYEDFHSTCFWVLLSTIAARRIAVNLAQRIYTAIMVTLVARTTLITKTTTTNALRNVLHALDLDWLLGARKPTPSKLISDMAGTVPANYDELDEEAQLRLRRRLAMSGQRVWIYPEFGKLVAAMQKPGSYLSEMGDLLLQFADNQEILDQATQVRGSEIIERPYLAFLGSMTPPSIKAYARAGAEIWNDGLFGRMTFSCPPRQLVLDEAWGREFVPVPTKLIEELKNWHERLIEPVVNISSEEIKGKGKRYTKTWTVEPQLKMLDMETDAYEAWKNYRSWLKKTVATFSPIHDFDATYGRLANTALGIAALAASIHGSEKIHLYHWALGQVQAEEWRKGVHRFHAQVNSYERAEDQMEKLIVEYLTQKGTEARIKDMRDDCRPIRRYTPKQVQDQVTYMEKQGVLSQSKKGKTVFYDLASKAKKSQTK